MTTTTATRRPRRKRIGDSESPDQRAGFAVKWIPLLVPFAAFVLALLVFFIGYEVLY